MVHPEVARPAAVARPAVHRAALLVEGAPAHLRADLLAVPQGGQVAAQEDPQVAVRAAGCQAVAVHQCQEAEAKAASPEAIAAGPAGKQQAPAAQLQMGQRVIRALAIPLEVIYPYLASLMRSPPTAVHQRAPDSRAAVQVAQAVQVVLKRVRSPALNQAKMVQRKVARVAMEPELAARGVGRSWRRVMREQVRARKEGSNQTGEAIR